MFADATDTVDEAEENVSRLNADERERLRNHDCSANYTCISNGMDTHLFLVMRIKCFQGRWEHPITGERLPRFIMQDVKMVRRNTRDQAYHMLSNMWRGCAAF